MMNRKVVEGVPPRDFSAYSSFVQNSSLTSPFKSLKFAAISSTTSISLGSSLPVVTSVESSLLSSLEVTFSVSESTMVLTVTFSVVATAAASSLASARLARRSCLEGLSFFL